jgi:hypothetical protein
MRAIQKWFRASRNGCVSCRNGSEQTETTGSMQKWFGADRNDWEHEEMALFHTASSSGSTVAQIVTKQFVLFMLAPARKYSKSFLSKLSHQCFHVKYYKYSFHFLSTTIAVIDVLLQILKQSH